MDQNLTSLIWTIVAIAAIFYALRMFTDNTEGYQNEQQTGVINQIQDIKQQKPMQQVQQMQPMQQMAQQVQQMQQMQQMQQTQPMQQVQQKQQQQAVSQQQVVGEFDQFAQQQAVAEQDTATNMSTGNDTLTSADLLPSENGFASWGDAAPENNALEGRNFLESGHHFGINTVGQSLRNANLQLRSDPTIPQVDVGPWLQSTIDQDTNKRQFEIGGDY
jgi:TolA-binding protein